LSVSPTNSDQLWWAPDAFGLIWKKEKTLALILEENGSEDLAKPLISNRQLSVDSATLLRWISWVLNFALADLGFTGNVWAVEGVSATKVVGFCWASMAQKPAKISQNAQIPL
jgi:hypothetical protein